MHATSVVYNERTSRVENKGARPRPRLLLHPHSSRRRRRLLAGMDEGGRERPSQELNQKTRDQQRRAENGGRWLRRRRRRRRRKRLRPPVRSIFLSLLFPYVPLLSGDRPSSSLLVCVCHNILSICCFRPLPSSSTEEKTRSSHQHTSKEEGPFSRRNVVSRKTGGRADTARGEKFTDSVR